MSSLHSSRLAALTFAALAVVAACTTSKPLSDAGASVRISQSPPVDSGYEPRSCQSLGYLVGRGGDDHHRAAVSPDRLVEYAMNDLRNQAAARGANFVQYDPPQLSGGGSPDDNRATNATASGNAYLCTGQPTGLRNPAPVQAARDESEPEPGTGTWTVKNPEGQKELKLILSAARIKLLLHAIPARSSNVSVYLQVGGKPASSACELLLASNGTRVVLGTPPAAAAGSADVNADVNAARAVVDLDGLASIAAAERVAGRVCEDEFVLSARDLAELRGYVMQVRETLALLPESAPASSTPAAAPTSDASVSAASPVEALP